MSRRVRKDDLDELLTAAIPLLQLDNYSPFDPAITKDSIAGAVAEVTRTREQEKLAADAYNSARDAAIAAERECCQIIIAARRHCVVQYGANSSVVRALGLKRRSEYKRPSRVSEREEPSTQV